MGAFAGSFARLLDDGQPVLISFMISGEPFTRVVCLKNLIGNSKMPKRAQKILTPLRVGSENHCSGFPHVFLCHAWLSCADRRVHFTHISNATCYPLSHAQYATGNKSDRHNFAWDIFGHCEKWIFLHRESRGPTLRALGRGPPPPPPAPKGPPANS